MSYEGAALKDHLKGEDISCQINLCMPFLRSYSLKSSVWNPLMLQRQILTSGQAAGKSLSSLTQTPCCIPRKRAMFYQVTDFLISELIFYCNILAPSFTICLSEDMFMDTPPRHSQVLKWDECVQKRFTARAAPRQRHGGVLCSSGGEAFMMHEHNTKASLWRRAVLSWRAMPGMWLIVGKTSLHTFPPVGFWNTVIIIKDLTYWLLVAKFEKQISM